MKRLGYILLMCIFVLMCGCESRSAAADAQPDVTAEAVTADISATADADNAETSEPATEEVVVDSAVPAYGVGAHRINFDSEWLSFSCMIPNDADCVLAESPRWGNVGEISSLQLSADYPNGYNDKLQLNIFYYDPYSVEEELVKWEEIGNSVAEVENHTMLTDSGIEYLITTAKVSYAEYTIVNVVYPVDEGVLIFYYIIENDFVHIFEKDIYEMAKTCEIQLLAQPDIPEAVPTEETVETEEPIEMPEGTYIFSEDYLWFSVDEPFGMEYQRSGGYTGSGEYYVCLNDSRDDIVVYVQYARHEENEQQKLLDYYGEDPEYQVIWVKNNGGSNDCAVFRHKVEGYSDASYICVNQVNERESLYINVSHPEWSQEVEDTVLKMVESLTWVNDPAGDGDFNIPVDTDYVAPENRLFTCTEVTPHFSIEILGEIDYSVAYDYMHEDEGFESCKTLLACRGLSSLFRDGNEIVLDALYIEDNSMTPAGYAEELATFGFRQSGYEDLSRRTLQGEMYIYSWYYPADVERGTRAQGYAVGIYPIGEHSFVQIAYNYDYEQCHKYTERILDALLTYKSVR